MLRICTHCLTPTTADVCPAHDVPTMAIEQDDMRCGALVADGLLVLGRLGAGGMGVVYRAWQRSMGRQVALKVLDAGLARDPRAAERFVREARVTAGLRSPHTVTVLDAGRLDDGGLFLSMELIEGRSLHALLSDEQRLSPDRAAGLAEQICRSLEEAHQAGVVHRDLKPANVMVSSIGNRALVKVLDFGVARLLDPLAARLTETGSLLGTPSYMSPEQNASQPVGPPTDVYALGLILAEMITGERRRGDDHRARCMADARTVPHAPTGEPDRVVTPTPLAELIAACLDPEPEARPTMSTVRRGLESIRRMASRAPAPNSPAAPALAEAPVVGDRYVLRERLGTGGSGVVYRAFDRERREAVALKALRRLDADQLFRFKHEFRVGVTLSHPNLVRLYDLVAEGPSCFFTMELIDGAPLLDAVRGPSIDEPTATVVPGDAPVPSPLADDERLRPALRQLAAGVAALHRAGLLHRDIKPHNTLVEPDGRVVLLDYGLLTDAAASARSLDDTPMGTPLYAAPEQMAGEALSPASDWYAVGVMLFEALAGRVPFGGSREALLKQKSAGVVPELPGRAPPDLARLCRALLARDPTERPPESEILRVLGVDRSEVDARVAQDMPFVGRDREFAVLHACWDDCIERRLPALVLMRGSPGVGKSTLIERFFAELRAVDDASALLGRCHERESVPYKALDALVDQLCALVLDHGEAARALMPRHLEALERSFPVVGRLRRYAVASGSDARRADEQAQRRRAFGALRDLIARLADRIPLALAIDDAHWGDADSGHLLTALLEPPDPPPVLIICAFRSEDADPSPLWEALARRGRFVELVVEPLDEQASRVLAASVVDDARVEAVARGAGGNPLLVAQLAHRAAARPGEIPTLDALLQARSDTVDPPARRVLELLAIAGGPLTVQTLANAAAIGDGFDRTLGQLEGDQMVRRYGPGSVDLWPNRLRSIVARGLADSSRRALHRALADALGTVDASADVRAMHLLAAGQRSEAAAQLTRAARDASAKLAFDRAADLYREALDAGAPVRVSHAEALARAGRNADAGEAFLAAAEETPADGERLRRRAADQFLRGGHLERGVAVWRTVLAPLGIDLPRTTPDTLLGVAWRLVRIALRGNRFRPREAVDVPPTLLRRADLTWELAQGLGIIDPLRGIHVQASSLLLALRAGHPPRVARALALDSVRFAVVSRRGQAKAHALLDRARALVDRHPDPYAEGLILLGSSILATHEGRWRQARRLGAEAEQGFRSLDPTSRWEVEMSTYFRIAGAWWLGDLPTCLEELPRLIGDARARGDRLSVAHFVLGPSYSPHLFRGAPELADDEIEEAYHQWRGLPRALPYVYAFRSRLGVAAYSRDTTRLRRVMDEMWPAMRRHPALRRVAYMRAATGDALCRTGLLLVPSDGATGRRWVERGLRLMRRTDLAWSRALARLHTAQLCYADGDHSVARDTFRRAADALKREEMGLFERIARVRHAELAGDRARRARALDWIAAHGASDPEAIVRWLSP